MASKQRTNFNREANLRGLTDASGVTTKDLSHAELIDLTRIADAAGCRLTLVKPVITVGTPDVFVIAPIASQTNTITITACSVGPATAITTLEIRDAAGDTLAVTLTAGALQISLANTTDSKNTLTLIKAAIDAALTSTTGAVCSTFITGTGSTQMVHGGTNTRAASAAGVTAGTGVKSSTAGTIASITGATLTIAPSA